MIGVVGEDADGQLIPYFITQTELGHRDKDPSESGNGEDNLNDQDTQDSSGMSGTDHEEKDPCEGGTGEVKLIKDEDSGCVLETPDASGPIGLPTQNHEKLTGVIIESKVKS